MNSTGRHGTRGESSEGKDKTLKSLGTKPNTQNNI